MCPASYRFTTTERQGWVAVRQKHQFLTGGQAPGRALRDKAVAARKIKLSHLVPRGGVPRPTPFKAPSQPRQFALVSALRVEC